MSQKKLLITGFDPFGGESINPSYEAVKLLPESIGCFDLIKMEVPTVYGLAADLTAKKAEEIGADVIVCVGQAGGRSAITPEVIGINLREASIADNAGVLLSGVAVDCNAPAAYFATLPIRKIVAAVKEKGIPCALSYSAGAFVCNDLLFSLLHRFKDSDIQIGFIHVPYLPEQAKADAASMPLQTISDALKTAIEAIADQ